MIVEDGSGLADSNSYCDIEFADTYFAERGRLDGWPTDDAGKEYALIKATDYIEMKYGYVFIGYKNSSKQALSWPRKDAVTNNGTVYASNEIPLKLKRACCEYAINAYAQDLMPQPEVDSSGYVAFVTKEKVGPIETRFAESSANNYLSGGYIQYPTADRYMNDLILTTNKQMTCVR